jgi:hypothetical protein
MSDLFTGDNSATSYNYSQIPGMDFGNPLLNLLASTLMQGRMFPRPVPGTNQSPYDAINWQRRNLDFFAIRNQQFANQMLFERIGGLNPTGFMTSLLSDPNGLASRTLAPFAGGNPVAAAMSAYGNLTTQSLAYLGRTTGEITPMETGQMMRSLSYKFYNRGITPEEDAETSRLTGEALNDRIDSLLKSAAKRATGQNWEASRGFKLEDIMGGYTTAVRTGLFTSSGGPVEGFNKFIGLGKDGVSIKEASASMKLMDAMRGVFGNDKSGSELWEATSSLLGTDSLTGDQDSAKLEDSLRRIKATARVLGVNIGVMTSMVDTFKDFARQSNVPFGAGGMGAMEASINAMNLTTLAKSTGGASSIRLVGGEVKYATDLAAIDSKANDQPLTKWLGAIYHKAGVEGNIGVQKSITDFLNDPLRDTSPAGYTKLLNAAAKGLGMNTAELQNFAQNNAMATKFGLDALRQSAPSAIVTALGTDVLDKFKMDLTSSNGGNAALSSAMLAMTADPDLTVEQAAKRYNLGSDKRSLDTLQRVSAARAKGDFNLGKLAAGFAASDSVIAKNPEFYGAAEHAMKSRYNSSYRDKQAALDVQVSYYKVVDAATSARLAKFNAPLLTQIANNLFTGELTPKGIERFFRDMELPDDAKLRQTMRETLTAAMDVRGMSEKDFIAKNEFGGLVGKEIKDLTSEERKKLKLLDPSNKLKSLSFENIRNATVRKYFNDFRDARLKPELDLRDKEDTAKFNATYKTDIESLAKLNEQLALGKDGENSEIVKKYRALEKRATATEKGGIEAALKLSDDFQTSHKNLGKAEVDLAESKIAEEDYRQSIRDIVKGLNKLVDVLGRLDGKSN